MPGKKSTPAHPRDLNVGMKAVRYEVVTLLGQMKRLSELQTLKKAGQDHDAIALNSLIESALLHLRALRDFGRTASGR